jgi:hypothetical protein
MTSTKPDTPIRAAEPGAEAPEAQPSRTDTTTGPAVGHGPGRHFARPVGAADQRAAMAACAPDPAIDAALDAVVDAAPPLTDDTRRRLGQLLGRTPRPPRPAGQPTTTPKQTRPAKHVTA